MEPREIPDKITELSIPGVWNGLLLQWETLQVPVTQRAVNLKLAHIHLETNLRSCHNWNLGNIKSTIADGRSWQFFACGEEIRERDLKAVQELAPRLALVKAKYSKRLPDGTLEPWVSVRFLPKHPWARFRAFDTLEQGIGDHLSYLRRPEHRDVLEALLTGDPLKYSEALRHDRYFTASPKLYADGLVARLRIVMDVTKDLEWVDVVP